MDNKVREWYLYMCNNKNRKPTVEGLINYWRTYKLMLDSKLTDRIKSIYDNVNIKCFEDFNKHPINTPY